MNKEQREAIRKRYKVYKKGAPCWSAFTGACPAKQDIPALLDALDEADVRVDDANNDFCEVVADRDRWKAKAEALEKVIGFARSCNTCEYGGVKYDPDWMDKEPCVDCWDTICKSKWKFGEMRFAEGGTTKCP